MVHFLPHPTKHTTSQESILYFTIKKKKITNFKKSPWTFIRKLETFILIAFSDIQPMQLSPCGDLMIPMSTEACLVSHLKTICFQETPSSSKFAGDCSTPLISFIHSLILPSFLSKSYNFIHPFGRYIINESSIVECHWMRQGWAQQNFLWWAT